MWGTVPPALPSQIFPSKNSNSNSHQRFSVLGVTAIGLRTAGCRLETLLPTFHHFISALMGNFVVSIVNSKNLLVEAFLEVSSVNERQE